MFCNNCGKEVNEDSVFCNYCGNRLKDIGGQENIKPSLKEEIKAAWKSGPEKAERERMEKERIRSLEQMKIMKQQVQNDLKPKDGKHHIILIKSEYNYWTSISSNVCNNQYIYGIEDILEMMQNDGYEIIDIKIVAIQTGQGYTSRVEVIVIYK